MGLEGFQRGHCLLLLLDQGQQGLAQAIQVPVGHVGLLVKGIARLVVGVVADMAGLVAVQKLERAVVHRQAQDAHVIGVHHPMAKAHRLPLRHHLRSALGDRSQQGDIGVGAPAFAAATVRVKALYYMVGQRLQLVVLVVVAEVLEVPKADKAGRHPGHHGCGLQRLAAHRCVRAGHAQGAGSRDAKALHGLAAQKFADAAA